MSRLGSRYALECNFKRRRDCNSDNAYKEAVSRKLALGSRAATQSEPWIHHRGDSLGNLSQLRTRAEGAF